tara:strand:+ start:79 stop:438 length:360 start_codon:yes stop_codon:yes gene_type:complete
MIKKVLIAGLFLGGGYFLIKKLLPNFEKEKFKAETTSIEDAIAQAERDMAEAGRIASEGIRKKFGNQDLNDIKTWMFAPNLNYDALTLEKIKESLANFKWTPEMKAKYDLAMANSLKGN